MKHTRIIRYGATTLTLALIIITGVVRRSMAQSEPKVEPLPSEALLAWTAKRFGPPSELHSQPIHYSGDRKMKLIDLVDEETLVRFYGTFPTKHRDRGALKQALSHGFLNTGPILVLFDTPTSSARLPRDPKLSSLQRALLITIIAVDHGRGLMLESPNLKEKMYFVPLNRYNFRYFTINDAGSWSDKSFRRMCKILSAHQNLPDLVMTSLLILKAGFNQPELRELSPSLRETLFDIIGITLAEEYSARAKTADRRDTSIDSLDLIKTIVMLPAFSDPSSQCLNLLTNGKKSRFEQSARQKEITADLLSHNRLVATQRRAISPISRANFFDELDEFIRSERPLDAATSATLRDLIAAIAKLRPLNNPRTSESRYPEISRHLE